MTTPLRERILQAKELEHERIRSEIRRNDAEAKKMEAEANCLKKSKGIFSQYLFPSLVGGILIAVCFLDTSKNLYDMTSYKIKESKEIFEKQNDLLKNERLEIEKQYLEILIKDASINAYGAYEYLVREDILYEKDTLKEEARSKACQLLHEYWKLVIKIATAKEHLFPEVKQKLAAVLKEGEEKDICPEECRRGNQAMLLSPIRRKSLDLIERHVAQIRAGNSQFPDDLINTFMEKLESQKSSNGENKNS